MIDIIKIVGLGMFLGLFIFGVCVSVDTLSFFCSEEVNVILEVTSEDITIEDGKFFINGPDNESVEIHISRGDVFDFTQHSKVYVKFSKNKPNFLYGGSDWVFDGIVKVD